jgi:drug/metabolite transporter (DMT)-like permease
LSFPTAKALMEAQGHFFPGYPGWFHAALVLFHRMAFAALLTGLLFANRLRRLRRGELWQGIQLGLWGAFGMLLQTDAQNRIPASTSAFFTQFTSVFLPVWVAVVSRRLPNPRVALASCLVVCGCALLSGVDFKGLGFGFGEWETILAAVLFSGQILALDQERFRANDMRSVAVVMFGVKALVMLPVVLGVDVPMMEAVFDPLDPGAATGWRALYASPSMWLMLGTLTLFCTVFSYSIMTQWQPRVSPVHAGLIYATEPVFATLWALFLPGWFSRMAGLSYQNESLGLSFFAGATAVLFANVLMAFAPPSRA